jgi:hypothetical protein
LVSRSCRSSNAQTGGDIGELISIVVGRATEGSAADANSLDVITSKQPAAINRALRIKPIMLHLT